MSALSLEEAAKLLKTTGETVSECIRARGQEAEKRLSPVQLGYRSAQAESTTGQGAGST